MVLPSLNGSTSQKNNQQITTQRQEFKKCRSANLETATKLERLEENLRSVDLEFTPEEWRDLNHAVSKIKLQGDRYPTDQEKQVGH